MRAHRILRSSLAGGSALWLISALGLWAQDQAAQNLPLSFGFNQTVEAVNNPGFDAPSSGTQETSITALSFGSARTTPTDSLQFSGGLGISVTSDTDGNINTALDQPHLGLRYSSTSAASAVTTYGRYSRDDLSRMLTPQDFTNDQGQIVLPTNPADLVGTGIKEDFSAGGSLEIGRDAPFGLTFAASGEKINYAEVTDPALKDLDRATIGVTGRFSYSPQGSVTLGLGAGHQLTFDSPENITRDTKNLTLGTSYAISSVLSVSGSAKYEVVDETGFAQETIPSAKVGADYTFLNGSLSFNIGTKESDLSWQQKLLAGSVSAQVSHGYDDSGHGTLDQASFNYNQAINDASGLNFGLFYSSQVASSTSPDVAATTLVASYNHQITKDWGMNVGANYRLRDPSSNTDDPASSAGVFVTVSRNVNFLR
jgi:hypothetical protein